MELSNSGRRPAEGPLPPPPSVPFPLKPALIPHRLKDKSKWFVTTSDAAVILFILRMRWETMTIIARELLARGSPFRTVEERDVALADRPPSGSQGLGPCKGRFKPTVYDCVAYLETRNQLLLSTQGRTVRLVGGLVGRIAAGVVPDVRVLEGPAVGDELVGFKGKKVYVDSDDLVLELSLDVVSGIYRIWVSQERTNRFAHMSFWPKHSAFKNSGLYFSQWLPDAEACYQDRLEVLESAEEHNLLSFTEWSGKVKDNTSASLQAVRVWLRTLSVIKCFRYNEATSAHVRLLMDHFQLALVVFFFVLGSLVYLTASDPGRPLPT